MWLVVKQETIKGELCVCVWSSELNQASPWSWAEHACWVGGVSLQCVHEKPIRRNEFTCMPMVRVYILILHQMRCSVECSCVSF